VFHRNGFARTVMLSGVVLLATASAAWASPVEGPAGSAFYTPPSPLPEGGPGTLVWYRPTTINLNVTLPSVNAWTVLYKSTGQHEEEDVVTGTVIVPQAAWTGSGPRPVVTYAEGTQGLGPQCAPSKQIAAGTEYDGAAIVAALMKGYAVVVTDYQGYTTGATPTYIAGAAEGHAVLDIVRAAQQLPGAGVSASAPTIIWGYSQGGQAAGWAGELLSSYAPELHVVGVAAGGVPANLQAVQEFGEGSVASGLGLDAVIGLAAAYPEVITPGFFQFILNEAGREAVAKLKSECALESLSAFHDVSSSSLTFNGETLGQLDQNNEATRQILSEQELGTMPIPVPVYHYHGLQDEFVPVAQDVTLHQAWCALGVQDDFQLYPGDHLLTDPTAVPEVMRWIGERLAGDPAPSTCGLHEPGATLPASARLTPETGDLVIPLPAWELSGSFRFAKIGLPLGIPAGSTLSAEADLTSGVLNASLSVPPIDQTINLPFFLVGLPVTVKGSLTPVGPSVGTVSLSNSGVLTQNATGEANFAVNSISIGPFTVPLGCRTATPISLPLSASEPANALYTGSFSFSAEVTVPQFTGCGFDAYLLSAVLSGPGNKLELSAAPAPPIPW
jgi:Secretory lipase